MGLPAIAAYPLPTAEELPAARVPWKVDPRRAVLLVHDMQRHFAAAYADGALAPAVANIDRLVRAARADGVPVVYTRQPGRQSAEDRGLLGDFWGAGVRDDDGARIIDELAPAGSDVVLTKWRYSAFQRTDLADRLAALDRDQLVVCGIYAHIGVQTTAVEAFMRDVQPFVVGDAVADFSRGHHAAALTYCAERCARVVPTAEVAP